MGVLRFYLAIAVLITHVGLLPNSLIFPFADTAVCCFFIVSGFYMSLVLTERYEVTGAGLVRFYLNRALRLFPIYWAVLALFQILRWIPYADVLGQWTLSETLEQVTLLPTVIWRLVTLRPDINTLFIGQSVTIGIEMIFYMTAPLLVLCRTGRLLIVWALAFVVLQLPALLGLPARPWQYEFVPSVFVFFVTGALAYRLWTGLRHIRWLPYAALPLGLAIPLACWLIDNPHTNDWVRRPATYLVYVAVTVAIPALFGATRRSKIDRLIGDLSYPVYLVQFFVMLIVCGRDGPPTTTASRFAVVAVTLALSAALVLLIDRPVERLRERVARRSGVSAPSLLKTAPATP